MKTGLKKLNDDYIMPVLACNIENRKSFCCASFVRHGGTVGFWNFLYDSFRFFFDTGDPSNSLFRFISFLILLDAYSTEGFGLFCFAFSSKCQLQSALSHSSRVKYSLFINLCCE